jgi:predicted amidohydrolase YtcJ
MKWMAYLLMVILFANACNSIKADMIVYNAKVYTINDSFAVCTAFAIKDGRFIAIGSDAEIKEKYGNATEQLDAKQQIIYPGFIDAHAHFSGYALDLKSLKLFFTPSEKDMLQKVKEFAKTNTEPWIIGRGWDQNGWTKKDFPTNDSLNKWFPNIPIFLQRIDGHAALCNAKALAMAGITENSKIDGGQIVLKNGQLTGLLIDNACTAIDKILPKKTQSQAIALFKQAQNDCFQVGVTSAVDCGISNETFEWLKAAYQSNELQFSQAVMMNDDSLNYQKHLHTKPFSNDWMKVIGFKIYADGALGSRGAYLLNDYHDAMHTKGLLLKPEDSIKAIAKLLINSPYQMCTHAIGDAGNRIVLQAYADLLQPGNDKRWRIEHAQVVDQNDMHYFGDYNIVPSVQPTHATSDMPWAADRLGAKRIQHAYNYQQLLQQNKWMPLGTDFPVEYINPFYTFYSAVFRIYDTSKPAFQMQDALTRQQALRGMTTWAAKGSFEEKEKGQIAVGMRADFVITRVDLLTADAQTCKQTQVQKTFVKGKCVWIKKESEKL